MKLIRSSYSCTFSPPPPLTLWYHFECKEVTFPFVMINVSVFPNPPWTVRLPCQREAESLTSALLLFYDGDRSRPRPGHGSSRCSCTTGAVGAGIAATEAQQSETFHARDHYSYQYYYRYYDIYPVTVVGYWVPCY